MDKRINSRFTFRKGDSVTEDATRKDQTKTHGANVHIDGKSTAGSNKSHTNKRPNHTANYKGRNQTSRLETRGKRESIYNTSGVSNKHAKLSDTQHEARRKVNKQKQHQKKPQYNRSKVMAHRSRVKSEAKVAVSQEKKYEKDKRKTEITNKLQRFKSEKKLKDHEESGDVEDGSEEFSKQEVEESARTSSGEQIESRGPESEYWVNVLKMADKKLQGSKDWVEILKNISPDDIEKGMKHTLVELKTVEEPSESSGLIEEPPKGKDEPYKQTNDDDLQLTKQSSPEKISSNHELLSMSSANTVNNQSAQTDQVGDEFEDETRLSTGSADNAEDSFSESSLPDSIPECLLEGNLSDSMGVDFNNKSEEYSQYKSNSTSHPGGETETANVNEEEYVDENDNEESVDENANELANEIEDETNMEDTEEERSLTDLGQNENIEPLAEPMEIENEINDTVDLCSECDRSEVSDSDEDPVKIVESLEMFEDSLSKSTDLELQFKFSEEKDEYSDCNDKQDESENTEHGEIANSFQKHEGVVNIDESIVVTAASGSNVVSAVISRESIDKINEDALNNYEQTDNNYGDSDEHNYINAGDKSVEEVDDSELDQIDVDNKIETCDTNQTEFCDANESESYDDNQNEYIATQDTYQNEDIAKKDTDVTNFDDGEDLPEESTEKSPEAKTEDEQTAVDEASIEICNEILSDEKSCNDEKNFPTTELHHVSKNHYLHSNCDSERHSPLSPHECLCPLITRELHFDDYDTKENEDTKEKESNEIDETFDNETKEETDDVLDVSIAVESINDEFITMLINEGDIPLNNGISQGEESECDDTNQSKCEEMTEHTESDTDVLTPLPGDCCNYENLQHKAVILKDNTEEPTTQGFIRERPMLSFSIVSFVILVTAYILSLNLKVRKE